MKKYFRELNQQYNGKWHYIIMPAILEILIVTMITFLIYLILS
ncbi:MAG: hypothetical protein ACLFUC_01490 [Bacteroidales bacterium]